MLVSLLVSRLQRCKNPNIINSLTAEFGAGQGTKPSYEGFPKLNAISHQHQINRLGRWRSGTPSPTAPEGHCPSDYGMLILGHIALVCLS